MTQDELLEKHLNALIELPLEDGDLPIYIGGGYLKDKIWFPDPRMNVSGGSELCIGPEVTPETVDLSYRFGIFPWFDHENPMPVWHAPLERYVLFPERVHVSHSMRTLLNKRRYRIEINQAFPEVIEACRTVDGRDKLEGGWLDESLAAVYIELWRRGRAMSVEVRDTQDSDRLVGGLYGIFVNDCFMGESMFSYVPSGSKMAMIGLCRWMEQNGGKMIDLQFETPHLKSMGGEFISYYSYLGILNPEAASTITEDFNAEEVFQRGPSALIKTPILRIASRKI